MRSASGSPADRPRGAIVRRELARQYMRSGRRARVARAAAAAGSRGAAPCCSGSARSPRALPPPGWRCGGWAWGLRAPAGRLGMRYGGRGRPSGSHVVAPAEGGAWRGRATWRQLAWGPRAWRRRVVAWAQRPLPAPAASPCGPGASRCAGAGGFAGAARAALRGGRQSSRLEKIAQVTSNLKRFWRFCVTVSTEASENDPKETPPTPRRGSTNASRGPVSRAER